MEVCEDEDDMPISSSLIVKLTRKIYDIAYFDKFIQPEKKNTCMLTIQFIMKELILY